MKKEEIIKFVHDNFGENYIISESYYKNQLCMIKIFKLKQCDDDLDTKTILIWDSNIISEIKDDDSNYEFEMDVLSKKIRNERDREDMADLIGYFLEEKVGEC